jgi:spermidine synthase
MMSANSEPQSARDAVFTEEQTPGLSLSFRVRRRLLSAKTAYQQLEIVETEEFGKLMALDGKVMLTERDERFYHEMLVHPSLLAHPQPQRVLVVGGGDGGTIREVLQHPCIERVIWVEIDEEVVSASREYLPSLNTGVFTDDRVELHVGPGEQVVEQLQKEIDIIIVDSTDPIGPAIPLFELPFFHSCARALKDGGIHSMQCCSPFFFPAHVQSTHANMRQLFASIRLYLGYVPSYPAIWSYCMGSEASLDLSLETLRTRYEERGLRTSYLTPEMYHASAVLPRFVLDLVND